MAVRPISSSVTAVQAVVDDILRAVAIAAWRQRRLCVETESKRVAQRHPTALMPLCEVREQFIRIAAEHHVAIDIN
jgi:hypothetical protein